MVAGKPLLVHVIERCREARSLTEIIVATDDSRIARLAEKFCRVEITSPDHPSGSDRIAEVAERISCEIVINIQGDEPMLDPSVIDAVAEAARKNEIATAATLIVDPADYENPNVVKVVVSAAWQALYFSRRAIPYVREAVNRPVTEQLAAFPFLKHLGIYGYQRAALLRLVKLPASALEKAECLEQLRALEAGMSLAVVQVRAGSIGVDVPEDVARVEQLLANKLAHS